MTRISLHAGVLAIVSAWTLLTAAPARGQEDVSASAQVGSEPRLTITDGEARFEGDRVRAVLCASGLSVSVPAGCGLRHGGEYPVTATARFWLKEVRVGDQVIARGRVVQPVEGASAPTACAAFLPGGEAAGYAHQGGVEEAYEPRPGGIEQLIRLANPVPEGADLEVEIGVETALEAAQGGLGVLFADPASKQERLLYGEPAIIDAAGRNVVGALAWEASTIRLKFPSDRLKGLAYPITVVSPST